MKQIQSGVAMLKTITGVLLFSGELFAQPTGGTVGWSRLGAVPMSATALAVMVTLFLLAGSWILYKKQKYAQSVLAVMLLATGVLSYKAIALPTPGTITIDNAKGTSGTESFIDGDLFENASDYAIEITSITCSTTLNAVPRNGIICTVGMLLQTGESCSLYCGT